MAYEFEKDEVYCQLVKLVLNSEGGYVNDPHDKGGPTKYGIAVNYNRGILVAMGIEDVRLLTYEQAKQIYYVKYYKASGADMLAQKSIRLAYLHFDASVNNGIGAASKFLRSCSAFEKIKFVAGAGSNQDFWATVFIDYLSHRISFYTQIATWQRFGRGWMNRIAGLLEHAKQMNN